MGLGRPSRPSLSCRNLTGFLSFPFLQVAERVLQQEHRLQGSELSLVPHYDVLEPEELAENTSGGDHPSTQGPRATKHALLRTGGLVTALQGAGTVTMGSGEEPGQSGSSLRTGPMGSLGQAEPVSSMPMGSLEQEGLVSLRPVGLQEQEGPMSLGPVGSAGPVETSKGLPGQEGLVEIAMDSPEQEGLVGPMEITMGSLEKAGPVSPGCVKLAGQEGLVEMVLLMEPGAMRFLQLYHEDLLAGLGDVAVFPLEGPDMTGFRVSDPSGLLTFSPLLLLGTQSTFPVLQTCKLHLCNGPAALWSPGFLPGG